MAHFGEMFQSTQTTIFKLNTYYFNNESGHSFKLLPWLIQSYIKRNRLLLNFSQN